MEEAERTDDWRPLFDDAFTRVLAAIRSGDLRDDRTHDALELCERFDVRPAILEGALQRLADIGLAELLTEDRVRFRTLDAVTWAEASWLLVGLVEVAMRATVPRATDADVDDYAALVAAARRAAGERGDELDPAVVATIGFWAERTPERLAGRLLVRTLQQVRYGLAERVPWRITEVEPWLASSLQAIRLRDTTSAERAAHVLARSWERYLTDSAVDLHVDPEALVRPLAAESGELYWADWHPDDTWYEVLGSVRDGSLELGREYPLRELTARFRVPSARLLPMIRRLEVMGLVHAGPDRDGSVLVTTPTIDDWAETITLLLGLQEMCMRAAIPSLTDDDVAELDQLSARVRREARVRDFAFTASLLEINRFFAVRSPNRPMRQTTAVTISRLAYILPEPPPFRQWDIEDFLQLLDDAVRARDPGLASAACHTLASHFDAHIADVRARYGSMDA